jgi:hypothetical protein
METFWKHIKFALNRFVRIGDASRIGAPDYPFNKCRDLDTLLFTHFEIPNNIDSCAW